MTFQHKIVLVTGGSSGIGLATARSFARQGAHVWLLARNCERLAAAQADLRSQCQWAEQQCEAACVDVSDEKQVSAFISAMAARTGCPDIVINSAGTVRPGYFQELEQSVFHEAMDVNYFGTLNVCRAVIPAMIARRSGHIVNICSAAAFLPVFGYSAYSASKHAVRGLSEVLRLELKPHGVHVSVVYPPDTDTPQLAYEDAFKPAETRAFNGGVVLSPAAVADAILAGITKRRFSITPGIESTVVHRLAELLGELQYPILDLVVSRAQRAERSKEPT